MLEFIMTSRKKLCTQQIFYYCEMDSANLAISGNLLEAVIKPEMKTIFKNEKKKHEWFPCTGTIEHKQYDKHTTGLFIFEWSGDGIVALNSKCY